MHDLSVRVLTWLSADSGAPEDRATQAELRIDACGTCLTEVADRVASSVRPSIRVSAAALANWLLQHRWRILFDPARQGRDGVDWAMAHRLGAIGGGFAWPDVTFSSDGERVAVRARRSGDAADLVRFLNDAHAHVSMAAFDEAVDAFVQVVVDRLHAMGLHDSSLVALAEDVSQERRDEEANKLRVAEARLGLDADEVEAGVVLDLTNQIAWAGEAASAEILSEVTYERAASTLPWLRERATHADLEMDLSGVEGVAAVGTAPMLPWERGVDLAKRLRQGLGIGLERADLGDILGADLYAAPVERDRPISIAAGSDARLALTFKRRHPSGRRFEAARAIGDWLIRPKGDVVSPMTDRKTARQQVQRAFAAEFLCPADGLAARITLPRPTDDEIEEAAEFYEVSEYTVRSTLVNRRMVDRAYLPLR